MGKTSKTIRICDSVLKELEEKAKKEDRSLSNVVERICEEYFGVITRKDFFSNGEKFLPIHMDDGEIYQVIHWLLSRMNPGNYSEVKVRKNHGGKGVEFNFDFFNIDDKGKKHKDRRYSLSIDPNWEILDYFDHWESYGGVLSSEKLKINSAQKIITKIKESIIQRTPPQKNKIFKEEKWTLIYSNYERYYL